ncbi:hypothetical protein V7S43_019037 [Phytophthora oleae]|uniref:Peptidase S74 domain-containing protein n=1 Tax=Phytophthora oleae TaxID=2107226 RepID=A0ABD3ET04_9STRA
MSGARKGSIDVGSDGRVSVASDGSDVSLDGRFIKQRSTEEALFENPSSNTADGIVFRVRNDMVVGTVPAQFPQVISPSDRRIKTNIEDVDEDDILQRLQSLEIKQYRYTDEWRRIRGIEDSVVRGVIAQQAHETFPEYVSVGDFYLNESDFSLMNFHQIDKQKVILDLVAAIHAQHRRFHVSANLPEKSGDVIVSSADSEAFATTNGMASTGSVSIETGTSKSSSSGSVQIVSGDASNGQAGNIVIGVGDSEDHGGSISLEGGTTSGKNSAV